MFLIRRAVADEGGAGALIDKVLHVTRRIGRGTQWLKPQPPRGLTRDAPVAKRDAPCRIWSRRRAGTADQVDQVLDRAAAFAAGPPRFPGKVICWPSPASSCSASAVWS